MTGGPPPSPTGGASPSATPSPLSDVGESQGARRAQLEGSHERYRAWPGAEFHTDPNGAEVRTVRLTRIGRDPGLQGMCQVRRRLARAESARGAIHASRDAPGDPLRCLELTQRTGAPRSRAIARTFRPASARPGSRM